MGGLVRSILASAVLLALIVGIPYGLVRYIGWPLPDHLPTWAEVQAVLLAPMTPEFLLGLFACVLWPLWARFTFDVFAAIPDTIRAAEWPRPVSCGPLHAVAGVLVSAVVVSILSSRTSDLTATTQIAATEFAAGARPPAITAVYQPTTETVDSRRGIITAALHTHADTPPAGRQPTEIVRQPEHGVYDSLWRLAERRLGDGNRWPEIWALNKNAIQVDGRVFTNPNLIQPGWQLLLPPTTASEPAPPIDTQPVPRDPSTPDSPEHDPDNQQDAPSTRAPTREQPAPVTPPVPVDPAHPGPTAEPGTGISISTGAFVGIGLASLITIALVTVRLHRRRRYRPGTPEPDDPGLAPVVRALRIAHDSVTLPPDDDETPITPALLDAARLPELDTRERAQATARAVLPGENETVLGVRDGHAVALNVARSRGLGLIGPGAHGAARALIVTLLARTAADDSVEALVVIPAADAHGVFGADLPQRSPARLRIVDNLTAALDTLEAELLSRTRKAHESDSGRPPAPLVLVASPAADTERRAQAILDNGSALGVAGIVLGQWRPGGTARVRDDGTVGATSPNLAEDLSGARLFTLPSTDATDLLTLLHDTDFAREPTTAVTAEDQPDDATADDASLATPGDEPGEQPSAAIDDVHDFVIADTAQPKPDTAPGQWPPAAAVVIDIPTRAKAAPSHEPEVSPEPSPRTEAPLQDDTRRQPPAEQQPATEHDRPSPSAAAAVEQARASAPDAPALHLQVLGRLHLTHTRDEPVDIIDVVAPRQREILVYLALHRDGCRRESLTAALWPDAPGDRPYNSFHATLSQLRRALRKATSDALSTHAVNRDGHYCLDRSLVTVDLWQVQDALVASHHAHTPQERMAALRRVAELYRGDLAERIAADWIDAPRESLRRDVLDALSALIRAVGDDDPKQMLALLEQARGMDPYNEAIYRDLMRVQARLGQHDSIPRTLGLLTTSLAELDQRPTRDTVGLADLLRRPHGSQQRSREAS
ncbi:MAG: transcriptional regulator [Actinophytocola sp.]|uniref:BTAD domain-containing putative transcriptional regulator n=1 Tax=Actinophytocola sp. TaxID=1872138 RepID=UPI00132B6985|nr:BTAD domain-containing putative transcriptional regulator [Actinophytocola sp.]MPZ79667.1 transcriptional regulator [Actinophytocola sp.]